MVSYTANLSCPSHDNIVDLKAGGASQARQQAVGDRFQIPCGGEAMISMGTALPASTTITGLIKAEGAAAPLTCLQPCREDDHGAAIEVIADGQGSVTEVVGITHQISRPEVRS
jgi:hypothetical protein